MPTVDQVLDKYVQAIGGEAALGKLTTGVMKGTIEIPSLGATGSFEVHSKAPNKQVQSSRIKFSNGHELNNSRGFDGATGWSLNATENKFRELNGRELAAEKRDAEFYRDIKLRELYPQMTLKGKVKISARLAYVIEATPAEGGPEKWYFDTGTGLLVRRDVVQEGSKIGQSTSEIYLEDYREVDGVKFPFTLRISAPGAKLIVKFNEIEHNVPIEDAKFNRPEYAADAPSAATVDEYIQVEMKKRRIPGLALVVIKNGEIVKMEGYGSANLEHDAPVAPDTVFELASVTKQFTATAIMKLVEEGKIKLDDPIIKYLPRSPRKWNGITVRHLLTHTAGLADLDNGFASLPGKIDLTTAEMFKSATEDPMSFAPGAKYQYSDVGYFLLGMIIEKAGGQRYRDFLAERFFKPLGMTSTSVLDQWTVVKNRAAGYTILNGQLVNIRRVYQVELPSHFGIFSTVRDLAKWDNALATGKVVKESSLATMWTPVKLNNGSAYPYGFGWEIGAENGHKTISHSGYTGTEYTRFPDDKLTVIVLTNLGLHNGDEPVDSWGLTQGVADRYLSGRH
jgi:CubicO group peptidase (beta-lactamase class C family)